MRLLLLTGAGLIILVASITLGELSIFNSDWGTLWALHGPRAVLALGVGGILAVSGALLQALFANPLCEPYTLGISSGAALGAVGGAALGAGQALGGVVEGIALGPLAGSLLFALPIFRATTRERVSGGSLLLLGVMLGFFGSSLVALILALSPGAGVARALVWLLGDLSRATFTGAFLTLAAGVVLTAWIRRRHAELDALLLGEGAARSLGVPVDGLRRETLVVVSLLVAWGVALSGMIGFVGLVVPHLVRGWSGSSHRKVLPLAFAVGGICVASADLGGRLLFSPREIPVGVLTALAGVPAYWLWGRRHA